MVKGLVFDGTRAADEDDDDEEESTSSRPR